MQTLNNFDSKNLTVENTTTIVAPASGRGGAVALVRLSGPDAIDIAGRVIDTDISSRAANTIEFARVVSGTEIIDEVMVALFRGPRSYTGDDMVEISCHGSSYIVGRIISLLIASGAVMAQPGEFTLRAFLAGKLDLSQAEAVADLISSDSAASHRIAMNQMRGGYSAELAVMRDKLLHIASLLELELDFSEEDVEFADRSTLRNLLIQISEKVDKLMRSFAFGNVLKNGVPVAIVGAPNVGKSTLLNRFAGEERAIVSQIAGTTRDFIEERIVLDGITFRFIDTAGLRDTSDEIETQGIVRTVERLRKAFVVLLMVEAGTPADVIHRQIQSLELTGGQHLIVLLNKSEQAGSVPRIIEDLSSEGYTAIAISAKSGKNIEELGRALVNVMGEEGSLDNDSVIVSNARHREALGLSKESLDQALNALDNGLPSDLIAEDIRLVLHNLSDITGQVTSDQVLENIFSKFCIGK